MADPVRLGVLLAIQAALRGMSRAAGYSSEPRHDSVVLEPVDLLSLEPGKLPLFIVAPDDRQSERVFHPSRLLRTTFSVLITAAVTAPNFGLDYKIRAAEEVHADIEKALSVDLTLGGLVVWTKVLEPDPPFMSLGSQTRVLVQQPVEVLIIRRLGAP